MYFNLLYLKTESFDLMRENGLPKNMQESVTHFNKKPSLLTYFFFFTLSLLDHNVTHM